MKRMITGIKPTGTFPHIGNLLGAMLPLRDQAKKYDTAIFIPDLHALTTVRDGKILHENIRNCLIALLAVVGKDSDITIFQQSDIVGLTKLQWILSCFTPYALMKRAHTFKDFENKKLQTLNELTEETGIIKNTLTFSETKQKNLREIDKTFVKLAKEENAFYEELNM